MLQTEFGYHTRHYLTFDRVLLFDVFQIICLSLSQASRHLANLVQISEYYHVFSSVGFIVRINSILKTIAKGTTTYFLESLC